MNVCGATGGVGRAVARQVVGCVGTGVVVVVLRRRWLFKLDLLKYNLGWEMIYNISIAVE